MESPETAFWAPKSCLGSLASFTFKMGCVYPEGIVSGALALTLNPILEQTGRDPEDKGVGVGEGCT